VLLRSIPLALAVALLATAPAVAADVSIRVAPGSGVRMGSATAVTGAVTEAGAPLAGRSVALEVRRHPFKGPWRVRATGRTAADGRYAFSPRFDRNHHVRVRLLPVTAPPGPGQVGQPGALSPVRHAYVLPAFTLAFAQRGPTAIRITQVYRVPRDARLTAPTRFYVGARHAKRAPLRAQARTRRVRAGRYRARATVRIPASFRGRFSYVSCFAYSKGSGMGDPSLRCPRRFVRLR
jgi:hypothetical protein